MTDKLQPGVGYVRHAGWTTMPDGTEIKGCIVEFPAGPPDFPISMIFEAVPVRLIREEEYQRLWRIAEEEVGAEKTHA